MIGQVLERIPNGYAVTIEASENIEVSIKGSKPGYGKAQFR